MDLSQFLPLLVGGASGLIGGTTNPELTPEQQRVWKEWWERYQAQLGFSKSPNLSRSDELTDLANQQALGSQSAARNRESLFGSMSATDLGNPSVANALQNVSQAETAQSSRIYADASRTGLARRDAAKNSLPSYLQGMGGLANNPGIPAQGGMNALGPLLQQFGQAFGARGSNPYGSSGGNTVNGQSVDRLGNATQQSPGMGGGSIPIGQWGGGGTTVNQIGTSGNTGSGGWEDWRRWQGG